MSSAATVDDPDEPSLVVLTPTFVPSIQPGVKVDVSPRGVITVVTPEQQTQTLRVLGTKIQMRERTIIELQPLTPEQIRALRQNRVPVAAPIRGALDDTVIDDTAVDTEQQEVTQHTLQAEVAGRQAALAAAVAAALELEDLELAVATTPPQLTTPSVTVGPNSPMGWTDTFQITQHPDDPTPGVAAAPSAPGPGAGPSPGDAPGAGGQAP